VIAGRYRLLGRLGSAARGRLEFWHGSDAVLARDIGLTLVLSSEQSGSAEWAAGAVQAILLWSRFSAPGCPRLLDVVGLGAAPDRRGLSNSVHAVAVADWASGPSLAEVLANRAVVPVDAETALGMLAPLAQAAALAHSQGLVLGCVHERLLRISYAGTASGYVHPTCLLADPEATPAEDVRGLGAVLYALLTGDWPLPDTELAARGSGSGSANGSVRDQPVAAPRQLGPEVPARVSELALSALAADDTAGQGCTAATVHEVITDLLADQPHPADPEATDATAPKRGFGPLTEPADGRGPRPSADGRSRARRPAVMGAVALVLLAAIAYLGVHLGGGGPNAAQASSGSSAPDANEPAAQPPSATAVVVAAQVYDPSGQPDHPQQVWRAFGTDPGASWTTDTYYQPFPALKTGVGIMAGFAAPVQLSTLTVTSPSVGSVVEIRSAPSTDTPFERTTLLAHATLGAGDTVVSLTNSQPVQHVLVWITKLGGSGVNNVTQISNLQFVRVAD
jgi:hypothetical protein